MARSQQERGDYDFRHSYYEIINSFNLPMSDKRQTKRGKVDNSNNFTALHRSLFAKGSNSCMSGGTESLQLSL